MANNEVKLRLSVDGAAQVVGDVDRVGDKLGTLDSRARQAAQGADTLKTALGAMATMGSVYAMVKMADAVTTLNTQLRLASGSAAEASSAYTALFDIAQKGRVSFTDLGTTYAAIARSGKEMGVSQARLLTVTQSISQAMTIGGGSAASMQAALVQLGQGLSSGVLRGEELNSVMEQTPRLAKALADGLGIPLGELRKLGEAGKLTSEQVINALEKAGPQLAKEMESATLTVGQAFTLLTNSATNFIGVADAASGASGTLAGALKAISGGIDAAGQSIKDNETAFKFITSGLAGAATAAGLGATAIGIGAVWAAVTLGGSAAVTAALAALGTVVGLAIAAGNELSHSEGIIKLSLAKINNEIEAAEKAKNYVLVTTLKERQALLEKELQDKQKKSTAIIGSVPSPDRALEREAAKQDAKAQAELLGIRQKLSGVDANYLPTLERLNELRLAGTLGEKEYIALVSDLATKNYKKTASIKSVSAAKKELKDYDAHVLDFAKENLKTIGEEEKAREKYIATLNRNADSVGAHVQKLQDEEAALRLSAAQNISLAQALELVAIGRLHEEQAKQMSYGDEAAASAIQTEIDKRRELMGLIGSKDAREANKKAVDELEKANQKAAEESEKFWVDALMRGFESGKGFFENFWDTIKNKIKTDVLRVMVQPVAQGITGMMGLSGAANAGSGAIGTASNAYTAYGTLAGGASAFGSAFTAGATLGTEAFSAGLTMMTEATGASSFMAGAGQALGAAIGPAGWAAMAAVAVAGLLSGRGETRSGAQYNTSAGVGTATYFEGPSGGEIAGDAARSVFTGAQTQINDLLKLMGSTASLASYKAGLESSGKGKGFVGAGGVLSTGATFGDQGDLHNANRGSKTLAEAMDQYINENRKAVLAALQAATDLPKAISSQLQGVDLGASMTVEQLTALEASISKVVTDVAAFNAAVQLLPLKELAGLSFDAASGLIAAAGGLDVLGANLGTYYTNFYSAEEQRAQTIKTINAATAGSGLDAATVTRDQFRQIVEAQDLTTDSGRATYAALLSVSGAMGGLITESEADAKTLAEAAAKLAETNQGWQDQLDVLTGKETERSLALRDATDESTRAIMRQVYAQEDLRTALERTIADTQNAADDLVALYGDVVTAMLTISPPVKSLVDQWSESTAELTALTQGLADALGELPEATALDRLKTTLATLASATNGIADISEQIFGLQAGRGDQAAVNLLQGRETALFAELATSNDPGAVAAKLASTMLTRIKLQGELADKVTNDALKSQFVASTTLAQLEKTNRDKQIDAIRKQISAAETLLDVVGSMKGYIAELRFSDLSALNPGDQLNAAKGNYSTLLAGANSGDAKAMQALQGGASSYLKEAQGYYGGATSQYASIFAAVTSGLEQFGATPVTDISLLQDQLSYLEKIEAASLTLQTVVTDTTDLQIEGLSSINTVLTRRENDAKQEAADNKKAVQDQITELKNIVAGQEAQIKQQAAIYEGLMTRLTEATKSLESLDSTSKQTAAAPV